MTTVAISFVDVPPPQPSLSKTVAVARTAMIERNVSQPIDSSHDTTPGTFWPWTPNAARDRTMVGTDPRLPAMAMMPQSRNDSGIPMTATSTPCQNDTPKP